MSALGQDLDANGYNCKQAAIVNHLDNREVVLEALRPGVQLNSLEHFMNIDDFAAVRPIYDMAVLHPNYYKSEDSPKNIQRLVQEQKARILVRALGNYGKDYDFNFDVSTIDKIVCSELAYQTYISIDWPTELTMGRYSITPDQVSVNGT